MCTTQHDAGLLTVTVTSLKGWHACCLCSPAVPAEFAFLSDFKCGFQVLRVLLEEYNK